jgi:3-hydroxyisobutyrate dehydrogenase
VLVGGDEAVYRRVKPLLDAIGDKVTRIGEIGCGTIAKLVHNTVSVCARMAIAEGLTLGVKAGVDPDVLLDALQKSSFGQGRALREMVPNIVYRRAFEPPSFALKLSRKDVGLTTELAREYHVPMLISALAEQQLEEALRRGWGEQDSNVMFRLQEERAGVELRGRRA